MLGNLCPVSPAVEEGNALDQMIQGVLFRSSGGAFVSSLGSHPQVQRGEGLARHATDGGEVGTGNEVIRILEEVVVGTGGRAELDVPLRDCGGAHLMSGAK